jgi:hypothetical protein
MPHVADPAWATLITHGNIHPGQDLFGLTMGKHDLILVRIGAHGGAQMLNDVFYHCTMEYSGPE